MSKCTRNALILLALCMFQMGRSSSAGFFAPSRILAHRRSASRQLWTWSNTFTRTSPSLLRLHTSTSSLMILRGGTAASAVLPAASQLVVAKLVCGLLAFRGVVSLVLAPMFLLKSFHKIETTTIQKDTLEPYLLQAIGAISIGMAIHIFLVFLVPNKMPLQRAMGLALLPRILFVLKSCLVGKDLQRAGGSSKFLSKNTIIMSWVTLSLLTGVGNPSLASKSFSSFALVKGTFLMVNPVQAATKVFDVNVSEPGMEQSRAFCRTLGKDLTTSAVFMGTLAFGVDPSKSAAYTFLVWMVLLIADNMLLPKKTTGPTIVD